MHGTTDAAPASGTSASEALARVSVVIPTRNAAGSLRACLDSLASQGVERGKIVVVDDFSTDPTPEIVQERGVRLLTVAASATRARVVGAEATNSEYVLNMDADQRILPGALRRALETRGDVVALEEISEGRGMVAMANRIHNARLATRWRTELSSGSGGIVPRLYRRALMLRAYGRIPTALLDVRPSPYSEDSLLFLEAMKDNPTVRFVPLGLTHSEETSVLAYTRKWIRYGRSAKAYRGTGYAGIVGMRAHGRVRSSLHPASLPAFVLRAPSFAVGYYL